MQIFMHLNTVYIFLIRLYYRQNWMNGHKNMSKVKMELLESRSKTPNKAKEESNLIMRDKERTKKYREALTVSEYYR